MCRAAESLANIGARTVERDLLPTNVIPRHYQLQLEPDFDNLTYHGKVVIDLEVAENSNSVTLHTLEIEIRAGKIISGTKGTTYALLG